MLQVINNFISKELETHLKKYLTTTTPGIQYIVVDKHSAIFEFAGGWADIQN